jgi:hypothetical protein
MFKLPNFYRSCATNALANVAAALPLQQRGFLYLGTC